MPTRSNYSLHNETVGENDIGDKECIWLTRLRILIEESLTWGANEYDFGANGSIGDELSLTSELTSLTWELMSLTSELKQSDIGANDHGDKCPKSVIFVEKTGVLW